MFTGLQCSVLSVCKSDIKFDATLILQVIEHDLKSYCSCPNVLSV